MTSSRPGAFSKVNAGGFESVSAAGYPFKRALDVCISLPLLVLLSPLILAITIAIALTDGRPVFFRQKRPGLNGHLFTLTKFRTMRDPKAEENSWLTDSARVTRLGRILRRTSLDELPELLSVLKGDMSLVGPRPLLQEYLPKYSERQARRHEARPGITGLAQISGRRSLTLGNRFKLDVEYVDTVNLRSDVLILLRTLTIPFTRGDDPEQVLAAVDDVGFLSPATSVKPGESCDLATEDRMEAQVPTFPFHGATKMARKPPRDVGTDDPLWLSSLESLDHDTYHRPEYVSVSAIVDGGEARAVVVADAGGHLLLPYVKRQIDGGGWDAVSPYGYSGPVFTRGITTDAFQRLLGNAVQHLADNGCTTVFLRSHPGLNPSWPDLGIGQVAKRVISPTVFIDLSVSPNELWRQMESGHRSRIRGARKRGYSAEFDTRFVWYPEFIDMYRSNMRSMSANSYYLFPDDYFMELKEHLKEELILVVALQNGEFAAGGLFMFCGDWVQYHLSATNPNHRTISPSKLLIDAVRIRAQAEGRKWLHLGGGRGGANDALLSYKAGFSPSRLSFHATGIILDSTEYARLSRGMMSPSEDDFFPAYRQLPNPMKEVAQ